MIAFDTETHLITPGNCAPAMVCVSWCNGLNPLSYGIATKDGTAMTWQGVEPSLNFLEHAKVRRTKTEQILCEILVDEHVVGHNVAYDMGVISSNYPHLQHLIWDAYEQDRVRDTMILAMLHAIKRGFMDYDPQLKKQPKFSLEELAKQYLGVQLVKDTWRLRYAELDGIPCDQWPQDAIEYSVQDAVSTYRVYASQRQKGWFSPDEWLQCRAGWGLHLMSCWGLVTNQDRVNELRKRLKEKVTEDRERLVEIGILRDSKGNAKVGKKSKPYSCDTAYLKQLITESYHGQPPTTDKGNVKTDGETLLESGNADLEYYASTLEEAKVLNDFVPTLQPQVNPRFNVLVKTGRTSCQRPNTQQPPRFGGVRECFEPHEGFIYLQADISKAELCGISQICYCAFRYSLMGDALRQGKDPHLIIASQLMGMSYEEVEEKYNTLPKDDPLRMEIYTNRQVGKVGNFGTWGGLGAVKFMAYAKNGYGVTIDLQQSHNIRNSVKSTFHEQQAFFADVSARGRGHTRQQWFSGRERGGLNFTDGCNTQFQGLIADAAKEATYELQRAYYTPLEGPYSVLFGGRLVNFIHDEWISEVPIERADEMAKAKSALLESVVSRWLPDLPVVIEVEQMDRWKKT